MNIKDRIKLLKVRQRADRFELENIDLCDQLDVFRDKVNEMARERGAAEAEMIRRHTAELAKARGDSTDVRQRIQKLENDHARAVEALEHVAPLWQGRPMNWHETITRQDLWYAWRGQALGVELHSDTQGTSTMVVAVGQGGAGSGGADQVAWAYGGGGSVTPPHFVRTNAERAAEAWKDGR